MTFKIVVWESLCSVWVVGLAHLALTTIPGFKEDNSLGIGWSNCFASHEKGDEYKFIPNVIHEKVLINVTWLVLHCRLCYRYSIWSLYLLSWNGGEMFRMLNNSIWNQLEKNTTLEANTLPRLFKLLQKDSFVIQCTQTIVSEILMAFAF